MVSLAAELTCDQSDTSIFCLGFEAGEQSILLQAADVDASGEISYIAAGVTKPDQAGEVHSLDQEQMPLNSNDDKTLVDTAIQPSQEPEKILQVGNQSAATQDMPESSQALPTGLYKLHFHSQLLNYTCTYSKVKVFDH